jgi:hypothetical protein
MADTTAASPGPAAAQAVKPRSLDVAQFEEDRDTAGMCMANAFIPLSAQSSAALAERRFNIAMAPLMMEPLGRIAHAFLCQGYFAQKASSAPQEDLTLYSKYIAAVPVAYEAFFKAFSESIGSMWNVMIPTVDQCPAFLALPEREAAFQELLTQWADVLDMPVARMQTLYNVISSAVYPPDATANSQESSLSEEDFEEMAEYLMDGAASPSDEAAPDAAAAEEASASGDAEDDDDEEDNDMGDGDDAVQPCIRDLWKPPHSFACAALWIMLHCVPLMEEHGVLEPLREALRMLPMDTQACRDILASDVVGFLKQIEAKRTEMAQASSAVSGPVASAEK